ncbi:MAG: DUF1573 domain-containing protein [Bacteroidia bacterium]|nr:DUF1573 domain-containing protein [Bacteroidia bacterium]
MKTRTITLLFVLFFSVLSYAQEDSKIKFEKTTHDFGNLAKDAPAVYSFKFTNTSEAPVVLSRVKASCGCTTPSWTKESVAPGKTGEINVEYNTSRVGPFTKTVTVTYDTLAKPVILYIKGNVEQPAGGEDFIAFAHNIGGLSFDKINHSIGTLNSDADKTLEIQVKNVSPHKITFTGRYEKEMMFEVTPGKTELIPGEKTTISIHIDGDKFITPGTFSKSVVVYTDEAENAAKSFLVNGNLNRVYSQAELDRMPNIAFETMEYDGGSVIDGEKVVYAYKFKNTGTNDLVIESVKASCGCTATAPKDMIIPGGGTSEIVATFDSRGRSGAQTKTITVRSNDPDSPTVILRLKVEVEKDPFHIENAGPAAGSQ